MADLVQLRLEDMVHELEVYEQKGLFSKVRSALPTVLALLVLILFV